MPGKRPKNLLLDAEVLRTAEAWCNQHDMSLSSLVENFLATLQTPLDPEVSSPVVRRLYGVARGPVDLERYAEYLARKYREVEYDRRYD